METMIIYRILAGLVAIFMFLSVFSIIIYNAENISFSRAFVKTMLIAIGAIGITMIFILFVKLLIFALSGHW